MTDPTAPEDFPIDTGEDEVPVTGAVEAEPEQTEPGDDEQVEHRDTGDSDTDDETDEDQADEADVGGPDQ